VGAPLARAGAAIEIEQERARLAAMALQDTMRGMAGAAVLAALAFPAAGPPEPERRPSFVASHGAAPPHEWLAAERVYAEVGARTRALDGSARTRVARTILAEATRAGLDPLVILAMVQVESSFNPAVVSSAGAVGLMQLLEPTMREVAVWSRLPSADPRDPIANVQAGTRYFAGLVRAFADVELALMAYNAGPNRIRRYLCAGAVPERFWSYPRKVNREMVRLRAAIAPDFRPAETLVASAGRAGQARCVPAHEPAVLERASVVASRSRVRDGAEPLAAHLDGPARAVLPAGDRPDARARLAPAVDVIVFRKRPRLTDWYEADRIAPNLGLASSTTTRRRDGGYAG